MKIEKELTITKKAISIEFKALHIIKHEDGTKAFIQFQINFDNATSELFEIQKVGKDFNDFYCSYNTTKDLFVEAYNSLGIDVQLLPDNLESAIINDIIEEIQPSEE